MSLPNLPRKAYGETLIWSDYNAVRDWLLSAFGVTELRIRPNSSSPTNQIDIDCAKAALLAAGGVVAIAEAVDITIDLTTTGANGLDTGSLAQGIYYLWLIGKDIDELVYDESETGSSWLSGGTVWTNGSATFGITDTATDLEAKYETTSGQSPYFIEVTDDGGKKATGYIRGIAKSGNDYTLDIFDDAAGSTQNWTKEGGFNESAATYTYDIKTRDGVIESVAGLASTSATSPTLPSGYTHKKRVGAFLADATPEVVPFDQQMQNFQYLKRCTLVYGTAAVTDTDISLASWVPAVALNVELVCELHTGASNITLNLYLRAYGLTDYLSSLQVSVGSGGEGGDNSKNYVLPVRTSGGVPYIGYKVTLTGSGFSFTIDVANYAFPLTADV